MRLVFALAFALAPTTFLGVANAQTSPAAPPATAAIRPLPLPAMPTWPEDGGGLCQCGYLGGKSVATDQPFSKNALGLKCMSAVEQCRSACGTTSDYRFVPHAGFSCPARPGETVNRVAMNARQSPRLDAR